MPSPLFSLFDYTARSDVPMWFGKIPYIGNIFSKGGKLANLFGKTTRKLTKNKGFKTIKRLLELGTKVVPNPLTGYISTAMGGLDYIGDLLNAVQTEQAQEHMRQNYPQLKEKGIAPARQLQMPKYVQKDQEPKPQKNVEDFSINPKFLQYVN